MSPEVITALGGVLTGILVAFFAFMRFVIKELKPNGGSSLKDQVNRLEQRVDEIYNILLSGKNRK